VAISAKAEREGKRRLKEEDDQAKGVRVPPFSPVQSILPHNLMQVVDPNLNPKTEPPTVQEATGYVVPGY